MEKLVLHTGLYEDGEIVIAAADAPVIDVRLPLSDEEWDKIIDQILDAELVITA